MTVMWDVQERNCAVCGRIFIPQAPKAKYCSEDCRRKHEQDRAKEARRTTRSWPCVARSR